MKKVFTILMLALSLAAFSQNKTKVIILDTFNKDGRINYSTKVVLKSNLGKAVSATPNFESIVNDEVDAMLFAAGFPQENPLLSKGQTEQILNLSGAPYAILSEASIDEQERLTVTTKLADLDAYKIIASESTNMSNTPNDILHGCEVLAMKMLFKVPAPQETIAKNEPENPTKVEKPAIVEQPKKTEQPEKPSQEEEEEINRSYDFVAQQQYQQPQQQQQQTQQQSRPSASVNSYDIITTKDGKDIQAKILEVTTSEIKYKKYNNQDGPTFTLNKSQVLIVRYQNGENEVFNNNASQYYSTTYQPNTNRPVKRGMRFKDYKDLYDYHNYVSQSSDPYSPGWSGVASLFIPGLGQCICGEWGRGLGYFGATVGLSFAGSILSTETGSLWPVLVSGACVTINDIISIVDAVHVAKIKNMYDQDMRGLQTNIRFGISPHLSYTNISGSSTPVVGMSFSLNF